MKEYTTSEMFAVLEKNPKLKFESKNGYLASVNKVNGCLQWDKKDFPTTGLNNNLRLISVGTDYPADKWTLVREPVTWQEAIQARINGKPIKCEKCVGCKEVPGCPKKESQRFDGIDPWEDTPCWEQLASGTWYIEQEVN